MTIRARLRIRFRLWLLPALYPFRNSRELLRVIVRLLDVPVTFEAQVEVSVGLVTPAHPNHGLFDTLVSRRSDMGHPRCLPIKRSGLFDRSQQNLGTMNKLENPPFSARRENRQDGDGHRVVAS